MAEPESPSDSKQRSRLVAELDRTLFVEAGAGSGKTTQMVERIVELVLSGTLDDITQLAAITFTEAAAADLRDRVRERLEREAQNHEVETLPRTRIDDSLRSVDDAAISTLHGFAQRILASHPIEAGLPPGFEVSDDIATAADEREHWGAFLDGIFGDGAFEPNLRRAFTLGLTLKHFRVVADEFADNWDRIEHHNFPSPPLEQIEMRPIIDALNDLIDLAAASKETAKSIQQALLAARPIRDRLVATSDPDQQLLALLHEWPTFPSLGSNVRNPELIRLGVLIDLVKQARKRVLDDLRLNALQPILARVGEYTLTAAGRRRHDGRIRFHDLLVLARRVLRSHVAVRRGLSSRYRLLLIDEFQDTDPLQIEIALLLALKDPDTAPERWEDAEIEEGRLFFVGDPKQSIYRFRRADIAVFERVRDRFSGAGVVELTVNFRSVPGILEWVNAVFDHLIGSVARPGQPGYVGLEAFRQAQGQLEPVLVIGEELAVRSAAQLRMRESTHLASIISSVKSEGWRVKSEADPGTRPARFSDIAILIPSRQVLGELERALDLEDVPYRVESRSLVFGTDEVRELLAILQAIDDPGDEVAVIAALRSPAFACSDAALARYGAANPSLARWNYSHGWHEQHLASLGADDPVLAAMGALSAFHEARMWLPVNDLVTRVITERRMVELTTARRRPRDHWRRLRMVQSEARAFVEAGGQALGDFISYMEEQSDEKASRVETVVSERDDDAVRILTVHGAKGLEFPVVVLAGLGIEYRPPSDRVCWTDQGPEVALGPKDGNRFETIGYLDAINTEKTFDLFERDRLLYVAATRACDHLIVSLYRQPDRTCAASRIDEALQRISSPTHRTLGPEVERAAARAVEERVESAGESSPASSSDDAADLDDRRATVDMENFDSARKALLDSASRFVAIAPTTLGQMVRGAELSPRNRFGRTDYDGLRVGRAVHASLQFVDLVDGGDLERLAAHHANSEGIPEQADIVSSLAASVLDSPSVRAAAESGRFWRELSVAAPLGPDGIVVEGYIDLLYESVEGGLVVVDYKTDRARDASELDAAVARYRLQGAAYAAVVNAALGRQVSRCVFVFARPGAAVEREIVDLEAAIDEVLASL